MTGLLTRTAMAMRVMLPLGHVPAPATAQVRGCAPNCHNEYLCDSNHSYYYRLCCFASDCSYVCNSWISIGTC